MRVEVRHGRKGADLCDDEDGSDVVPFFRALQEDDCLPQDRFDLTVVVGHGLLDGGGRQGDMKSPSLAKGTPVSQQTFLTQGDDPGDSAWVQGPNNKEFQRRGAQCPSGGAVCGAGPSRSLELTWPGGSPLRCRFPNAQELPAP